MFIRIVSVAILLGAGSNAIAGYYTTIDAKEEVLRFSRDFDVFSTEVMDVLGTIPAKEPKTNPPIRRRYFFIEAISGEGKPRLDTLERKLSYSEVLIRRGRTLEASRYLGPIYEDHPDNFVVQAQYASALFLANSGPDSDNDVRRHMREALKIWPAEWADLKDEQKKFVTALGWNEYEFIRYRRSEVLFDRLLNHRLKERKKKPVEETLDPIFLDAKNQPIRFVNEDGQFEAGRIAKADKEKMPRDSVELVEQLLIWMPGDERLLWLLAETFNASAMEYQNKRDQKVAVHNAKKIFDRLTNFETPMKFARAEVAKRAEAVAAYAAANRIDQIAPLEETVPTVEMTNFEWWRLVGVASFVGFAVGVFALWQIQEIRRRGQGRR